MGWIRGEKLGHGSFATVSLAVPTASRSRFPPPLMAVKSCGASLSSSLAAEKLILEELEGCPEIIRCFGDSFSSDNGETLYNVLLEYAAGGSLSDRVKSSGDQGLPESEVRGYTAALLKGLRHVHGIGYVHCDVKLQNILLCSDGTVRIADFGLARRAGTVAAVSSGCDLRGTPMYMSPEMVAGGEQGAPADIWAVGCAVAEMAGGGTAWSGFSDVAALMMRIGVGDRVPDVPGVLSEEGKDFLGRCFEKDSRRRWTAEMLLNHPFVRGQVFDGGDDGGVASPKDTTTTAPTSPRCPFGFPDWVSCSITSMPSPGYLRESELWFSDEQPIPAAAALPVGIVSERSPDWTVSDDWITVRH